MSVKIEEKLFTIRYKCDEQSHLIIKNHDSCLSCKHKDCTFFCPEWDMKDKITSVAFENCIECGTCRIACPTDNIEWVYPKGGYGITYKFG